MNKYRIASLLAATALTVAAAPSVGAQTVSELKAQLEMLAKRIEQLEKQQLATPVAVAPRAMPVAAATPVITKAEPAFALATPDGNFEFNVRGRIITDLGIISDNDDSTNIRATEFRSARLAVEGKAWKNVGYRLVADFAGNDVSIEDAYLEYKSDFGKIRVGHFKSNNSLEEITSLKHITFLERAAFTDAFDFDRHFGIGYITGGDNWSLELGAFKGNADTDEEGYALLREFGLPFKKEKK